MSLNQNRLINSISFENFFNYSGKYENNTYNFKEGVNIIIGDNNYGKSKMYNAFLWLLNDNDQLYDSDLKRLKSLADFNISIISDMAKKSASKGETISTKVKIVFTHRGVKFQLEKIFKAKKISDDANYNLEKNWEFSKKSEFKCDQYFKSTWKPIHDIDKIKDVKKRIIPNLYRKYMWFQGEEVDKLFQPEDEESLIEALDMLSSTTQYSDLLQTVEYCQDESRKDLKRFNTKNSTNKDKTDEISKKIDNLNRLLDNDREDLEENKRKLNEINSRLSEIEPKIDNAELILELQKDVENAQANLDRLIPLETLVEKKFTNLLFDEYNSYLLNSELASQINDRYKIFKERRAFDRIQKQNQIDASDEKLPIGMPKPEQLKLILEPGDDGLCTCGLCKRKFEVDSDEYKTIEERYFKGLGQKEDIAKSDFSSTFDDLSTACAKCILDSDELESKLEEIKNELNQTLINIEEARDALEEAEIKYNPDDPDTSSLAELVNEFKVKTSQKSKRETQINMLSGNPDDTNDVGKIGRLEQQIISLEKQLEEYSTSHDNLFREKYDDLTNLSVIFERCKKYIFQSNVVKLQELSNEVYENITKGNLSSSGQISFTPKRNGYVVDIIGKNGEVLAGQGDGLNRLKKLSVITAISKSNADRINSYPFISDAPTSSFGSVWTDQFFKGIPQEFGQSIIMTKDLLDSENMELNELGLKIKENNADYKINSMVMIFPNNEKSTKKDRSKLVTLQKDML